MRNLFIMNERRRRLQVEQTGNALALLGSLAIELDDNSNERDLLDLARRHRLTVYDASYLELAKRRDIPSATLDRALLRAATPENIPILGHS